MSAKEFDELIKSKLGQADFAYSPEDYRAMNTQLVAARQGKSSRKIFFWLTSIAACMLIGIVISALTGNSAYKGELATKKASANPVPAQNTLAPIAKPKLEAHEVIYKHAAIASIPKYTASKQNISPQGNDNLGIAYQNLSTDNIGQKDKPIDKPVFKGRLDDINFTEKTYVSTSPNYTAEPMPGEEDHDKYSRRVNISLAGGVNYGSANQGYLFGASIRKELSRKLYIEGDVGYANSSSQKTATIYSQGAPVSNISTPVPPVVSVKQDASTFNYLQLSPSVGYHIHKKIAVGIGADLQRLLQGNTSTTASTTFANGAVSETGKIMPDIDYGIIAKTEYLVSPRLKAGVQYREGMNNFLSNSNKYFDRSYFQLQVKYSLFK